MYYLSTTSITPEYYVCTTRLLLIVYYPRTDVLFVLYLYSALTCSSQIPFEYSDYTFSVLRVLRTPSSLYSLYSVFPDLVLTNTITLYTSTQKHVL